MSSELTLQWCNGTNVHLQIWFCICNKVVHLQSRLCICNRSVRLLCVSCFFIERSAFSLSPSFHIISSAYWREEEEEEWGEANFAMSHLCVTVSAKKLQLHLWKSWEFAIERSKISQSPSHINSLTQSTTCNYQHFGGRRRRRRRRRQKFLRRLNDCILTIINGICLVGGISAEWRLILPNRAGSSVRLLHFSVHPDLTHPWYVVSQMEEEEEEETVQMSLHHQLCDCNSAVHLQLGCRLMTV